MNEREMFEKSFERPKNFRNLTPQEQWEIDKKLGILDWEGDNLTEEDFKRIDEYYNPLKEKKEPVNLCTHCECKGDLTRCLKTECCVHETWLVKELKCRINLSEIV